MTALKPATEMLWRKTKNGEKELINTVPKKNKNNNKKHPAHHPHNLHAEGSKSNETDLNAIFSLPACRNGFPRD